MDPAYKDHAEWLETDGLGGFASCTVGGARTRRYHGLLISATTPPTGRYMLVNGIEAFVETPTGVYPLSTQRYADGTLAPDGANDIQQFTAKPWPRWVYQLTDGVRISQELFMPRGRSCVAMAWRLLDRLGPVKLRIRPLLSGRDYHGLHHENGGFRFEPQIASNRLTWQPYAGVPCITVMHNGEYTHEPVWYRNFLYDEERSRGFDATEDLASPGWLTFTLDDHEAVVIFIANGEQQAKDHPNETAIECFERLAGKESRCRQSLGSPLHAAADKYLVRRGEGMSVIAGYPWFADWGRDTFISLRGLCLATQRYDVAEHVLLTWGRHLSRGMLPNRFPDQGDQPEYNSVDASLWYTIAAFELIDAMDRGLASPNSRTRATLLGYIDTILDHYAGGTRHGIRSTPDGLLASGEPGVQLTWMDARVAGHEITPRHGKPVEVQALWLNALVLARQHNSRWDTLAQRGCAAFRRRFWCESKGHLYDVIDGDHQFGNDDATFRPNQLFAIGGLPLVLIEMNQARRVVEEAERRLWTPMGLRSLGPQSPGYAARYEGGPAQRDAVYHQGTVWPWLIGPFVEAWVRVHKSTALAKREARERFVEPLMRHLDDAGLGHISEIADADTPHTPRGCPFQAWSIAELLRLTEGVLADAMSPEPGRRHPIPSVVGMPM